MAKPKFDGVVEAVRYRPDGQIAWVRAYVRRGAIFSDRIQLDRNTLVAYLKSGKHYMTGKRLQFMAGTFDVGGPLRLVQKNNQDILAAGDRQMERDWLEGVPVI